MGRRLACASRVSVAVDLMALVILSVAILWTFASLSATPFEPRCSLLSPSEYMGLNHTSAPYVNFGMATVTYSCRINFADTPLEGFKRRRSWRTYSVPFAIV